jgi:serine/threonine protein kinase
MNWLRNSGPALSQMEFAHQFAQLLHVLHDKAGVVHLDLRLDNIVISNGQVGFVDFGSAVRLGENIAGNNLLSTLFEELMRTSQIQRMLERMTKSGSVTSAVLREGYGKVDKAVDLFYMAMQISAPGGNPDLRGLINWTTGSAESNALARLRKDILRPPDAENPGYRTARDILEGIERLQRDLKENRPLKTIPLDETITI